MSIRLFFAFSVLASIAAAQIQTDQLPTTFTAKCVGITDGDTLEVLRDGRPVKIRLDGIDAPESGQAFGQMARQGLSMLAFGHNVLVIAREKDRYGRTIATIISPSTGTLNVNATLVRNGLAWHYKQYSKDLSLARHESEARFEKLRLWSDPNPTPPWVFRTYRGPAPLASSSPAFRPSLESGPVSNNGLLKTVIESRRNETGYQRGGSQKSYTGGKSQTQTYQPGASGKCPRGGSHARGKVDRNGKTHCAKCGRFM